MAGPLDLPVLTDGVVLLRPFADADAGALAEIWRDPVIRSRNTLPEPTDEAALKWIALSAARAAAGKAWEWAIVDLATDRVAGRRALKHIDWTDRRASAAAWVGPRFRGDHFAARSLRLAAGHAFAQGLVRIQGDCEVDNEAGFRSMVSAGMRHEGTLRAYFVTDSGEAVDEHVLGMLPADLAAAPPFRPPPRGQR